MYSHLGWVYGKAHPIKAGLFRAFWHQAPISLPDMPALPVLLSQLWWLDVSLPAQVQGPLREGLPHSVLEMLWGPALGSARPPGMSPGTGVPIRAEARAQVSPPA